MEIFLNVLDPEDTSTGGGSASAIAGAMAGALIAMVSNLSHSIPNGSNKVFYDHIYNKAKQVSQQLIEGSKQDTQAFQSVRKSYQLTRQTEEEKITRQQAIQAAWLEATQVPLKNAKLCMRVYELATELAGKINPQVISDFRCAILLAHAGLLGCLENVTINLPMLKDKSVIAQITQQTGDLRDHLANIEISELLDPSEY